MRANLHTLPHFPPSLCSTQGGGLYTAYELIATWHGPLTHAMFHLLSSLAAGNSFVKNAARQGSFLPLLLAIVRNCTASSPKTSVRGAVEGRGELEGRLEGRGEGGRGGMRLGLLLPSSC